MKELIATYNSPVVYRLQPFRSGEQATQVAQRLNDYITTLADDVETVLWLNNIVSSTRFYSTSLVRTIKPFYPYADNVDDWMKQFDTMDGDEARNWVEEALPIFVTRIMAAAPTAIVEHPGYSLIAIRLAIILAELMQNQYLGVRETILSAIKVKATHYGKKEDGESLQENLWPLNCQARADGEPVYVLL
jgi:hypothetical protein